METPVLLIVFNRPECTREVFQRIGRAKPSRFYIAADGPRSHHASDGERCAQARCIKDLVSWSCDVKAWYRDDHLGPDRGVSSAIDWFFENEPEGIILEDDCLPEEPFFGFCAELLGRFRDDNRVMHICGINPLGKWDREPYAYYFSRHATTGGWATWRRAWKLNSFNRARYEEVRRHGFFDELFPTRAERARWFRIFEALGGSPDLKVRWRDRWAFSRFIQSGLSVVPRESLVAHLDKSEANGTWLAGEALSHPPYVMRSMEADRAFSPVVGSVA